jgi:glycine/D-amino acid oxidase-like deaminating enzyme
MLGGEDRPRTVSRSRPRALLEAQAKLRDHLLSLYPPLAQWGLEYAWEGLFAQTPDGLPYIGPHRRYPRHLFALGYGGNGMSVAFLAAQILLRRYLARSIEDDDLFGFGRSRHF